MIEGGIVLIVAALLTCWVLSSSQSFQKCEQEAKHQHRNYALYEKPAVFLVKLSRAAVRLGIHTGCTWQEADTHHDGIIALFTVALSISTYFLWRDTHRLALGAEDQSRDMQESIKQATLAARAMERSALATREAVESARSSDRAWVFFEGVEQLRASGTLHDPGSELGPGVQFADGLIIAAKWKNGGNTPAIKVDMRADFRIVDAWEKLPTFNLPSTGEPNTIIGQGMIAKAQELPIVPVALPALRTGKKRYFVYSKVEYRDIFDSRAVHVSEVMFEYCFNGSRVQNGTIIDRVVCIPQGPQNRCI